jgi:hypothetical protein
LLLTKSIPVVINNLTTQTILLILNYEKVKTGFSEFSHSGNTYQSAIERPDWR